MLNVEFVLWLTIMLTLTYDVLSQGRSAHSIITRNVQLTPETEWVPYTNIAGVSLISVCSQLCLEDDNCVAVMLESSTQLCHLSTCPLTLYQISNQTTDLVYWQAENKTINGSTYSSIGAPGRPSDCQEAFETGARCSGVYTLVDINTGSNFKAFCKFDGERGWTVIQRRLDGSVDFFRGWDDYVDGFGDVSGEYWIGIVVGLNTIASLTTSNRLLSVYLADHEGEVRYANYSEFYIETSSTNYELHVDGYSGNAQDAMYANNRQPFSTKDRDNDESPSSCAQNYTGGWWFISCNNAQLNGQWHPANKSSEHAQGIFWKQWRGYNYSLRSVSMLISR